MRAATQLIIPLLLIAGVQLGFSQGGLVAYYPFSDSINDSSGNGNNGVLFGGVSLAVDRFGNPNSACAFDGTGYITVNNSPSLQTGSVWSIAFWFKVGRYGPDNWMGMVTKAESTVYYDAGPRQMLSYENTSNPISYSSMGPPPYVYETSIPLEWNYWHHSVLTCDGDSVRSYLNGTRKFTFPWDDTWTFSNCYPLTIGSQNGSFHTRYFNGSIDEVRIYNHALSQTEIDTLYHEGG
jgi:hypothetical protein